MSLQTRLISKIATRAGWMPFEEFDPGNLSAAKKLVGNYPTPGRLFFVTAVSTELPATGAANA